MNRSTRTAWLWAPVAGYMALIFYLSSLSQPPLPQQVSDKAGHTTGYTGLGLLAARAVGGGSPLAPAGAAAALGITVAYGASDEIHQSFVAGRSSDVRDVYTDAVGGALGTAGWWAWSIIRRRRDV